MSFCSPRDITTVCDINELSNQENWNDRKQFVSDMELIQDTFF